MTNEENNPWWQVDLERLCTIETITFYNRTDAAQEKLRNYWITVMDDQGKTTWRSFQESYPDPSVRLKFDGISGRTVKVQLNGISSLDIAEVVVAGKNLVRKIDKEQQ